MNKVQLIGYLGKDPIIKRIGDGTDVAVLRLATDRFYFCRDGKPKKVTEWHAVVIWGKTAVEKMKNYIIKGSHVLVEGSIRYKTFSDESGQTRTITEIHATQLVDLDR